MILWDANRKHECFILSEDGRTVWAPTCDSSAEDRAWPGVVATGGISEGTANWMISGTAIENGVGCIGVCIGDGENLGLMYNHMYRLGLSDGSFYNPGMEGGDNPKRKAQEGTRRLQGRTLTIRVQFGENSKADVYYSMDGSPLLDGRPLFKNVPGPIYLAVHIWSGNNAGETFRIEVTGLVATLTFRPSAEANTTSVTCTNAGGIELIVLDAVDSAMAFSELLLLLAEKIDPVPSSFLLPSGRLLDEHDKGITLADLAMDAPTPDSG